MNIEVKGTSVIIDTRTQWNNYQGKEYIYDFNSRMEAYVFMNSILDDLSYGKRLSVAIDNGYTNVKLYKESLSNDDNLDFSDFRNEE